MNKQRTRMLICTFVALTSGLFCFWAGGQMSSFYRTQSCYNKYWGLTLLCESLVKPAALWQGSTTGLWTGTILGAFMAGLATSKYN